MSNYLNKIAHLTVFSFASLVALASEPQTFPWQEAHAQVLQGGDLKYAPQPFVYQSGDSIRYIDFETGDDSAIGSREHPWKHHPWDNAASGQSKSAANERHTYVFKGGVTYRGQFVIPETARGTAEEPIRLTSDPSWGEGPAVLSGAKRVTGWTQSSHPKMPESAPTWSAEVDFLPRNAWVVASDGAIIRLRLARFPNWQESNRNELMSEWLTWDQPEWWKGNNVMTLGKNTKHVGIADSLPRPLKDLVGGTVWSEWGIVMGSPYPARIEAVDTDKDGIAFRGPWTYDALEKIITGNRFYLENLPQFLDEPGEFWVEKIGDQRARIYLRFPNDAEPQSFSVEAACSYNLFEGRHVEHVQWSGLTFRFGNIDWDYDHPRWGRPNLQVATIRIVGSGDGIVIANNTFEHLPMPIRIQGSNTNSRIGKVIIRDNQMTDTDAGAIAVENFTDRKKPRMGTLGHVDILRNRLERIGMRIVSGEHGHAVNVAYPETSYVAGNFLHRIAGWGIAVWGGKPSGRAQTGLEAPLSRHLIHHNRVEDVLLKSNDWGGIETWQGGSHYVFNNVVINAIGYKHWIFEQGKRDRPSSFGHAYYLDGSFKNYLFNNIGLGRNNDVSTPGVNLTAIQNIISFENWFFNNSFHRFVVATRQQAPSAGRFRYLGNVFSDISQMLYRHAEPKDGEPDPNASHYSQGGTFNYPTLAYAQNFVYDLAGTVGTFEETGIVYREPSAFSDALGRLKAQQDKAVHKMEATPFRNPDSMDWRPTDALAKEAGVKVFVPWGLARTVGEWHFTLNPANPNHIIDEHWLMTAQYADRKDYKTTPRYPLIGEQLTANDYTLGVLEDWTAGALKLDGGKQFLHITHASLGKDQATLETPEARGDTLAAHPKTPSLDIDKTSFLIEIVFRTTDSHALVVEKMEANAGYGLKLSNGRLVFVVGDGENLAELSLNQPVNEGKWHHLIAEYDRTGNALNVYLDGKRMKTSSAVKLASLSNSANFFIGGKPTGNHDQQFSGEIEFLRVALSTLSESKTSIEELYAWQFRGPQHTDFSGKSRNESNSPGAIVR